MKTDHETSLLQIISRINMSFKITIRLPALPNTLSSSKIIDICRSYAREACNYIKLLEISTYIHKQDILLEIIFILRLASYILPNFENIMTSQTISKWNKIFHYTLKLFNQFFATSQYPQIYAQIVTFYVFCSYDVNYKENRNHHLNKRNLKLITESFKYFNIGYVNKWYKKRKDWQFINQFAFKNDCIVVSVLKNYFLFDDMLDRANILSACLEPQYLRHCLNNIIDYSSQYSLFGSVNDPIVSGTSIICQLFVLLSKLLFEVIGKKFALINVFGKIINKFAYSLINLFGKHKIIDDDDYSIVTLSEFWRTALQFFIFDQFDADKAFLAAKKYLSSPAAANMDECDYASFLQQPAGKDRHVAHILTAKDQLKYHHLSTTRLIMCYFIANNEPLFEKYIKHRRISANGYTDIYDTIWNDLRLRHYFFSSNSHTHRLERVIVVWNDRKRYARSEATMEYFEDIFQKTKNVTILCNIAMGKQCNYSKCNRKDIKLKRCKNCVSVYYCRKLCQKNDWLSHKRVCKKLKSRDYTITFC